jgi:serine/threonine-protein kinase RsbW
MRTEGPTVDPSNPVVEFGMPADPQYVRVARLVAGDMAERAGFSVDELDDIRLAVDELCAILIGADGSPLELRMQAIGGELVINGTTAGPAPVVPSELSETLLRALVDSCTFDASEHETSVILRKQARDIP